MNGRGGSTEVENKAISKLRRAVGEKKAGPLGLDLMGAAVARIAGWTDREAALLEEGMRLVGRDFRHPPPPPILLPTQSGLLLMGSNKKDRTMHPTALPCTFYPQLDIFCAAEYTKLAIEILASKAIGRSIGRTASRACAVSLLILSRVRPYVYVQTCPAQLRLAPPLPTCQGCAPTVPADYPCGRFCISFQVFTLFAAIDLKAFGFHQFGEHCLLD